MWVRLSLSVVHSPRNHILSLSKECSADQHQRTENHGWFPDAFMGTIGQVFRAVAGTGPLRSSVEDNVDTLKLVDALYRSMDSGASAKF